MPSPTISIVTPSYNQGRFLEEAIQSVLGQNYAPIEYVVIDGGSTDNSSEIIQKYENKLAYWVSEPDQGQYDGINKGFAKTTGEIMTWINSDDKYTPWAFPVVAELFTLFPQIEWISTIYPLVLSETGLAKRCATRPGFSRSGFWRGEHLEGRSWYAHGFIQQESTFWRRSLWEKVGGAIDSSLRYAGDFDLWARFYKYADLYGVATPLGCFRYHAEQKTSKDGAGYLAEAEEVFRKHGGKPAGRLESTVRARLLSKVPYKRLSKLGLRDPYPTCVWDGPKNAWEIEMR